jgi:hypothetical protein
MVIILLFLLKKMWSSSLIISPCSLFKQYVGNPMGINYASYSNHNVPDFISYEIDFIQNLLKKRKYILLWSLFQNLETPRAFYIFQVNK